MAEIKKSSRRAVLADLFLQFPDSDSHWGADEQAQAPQQKRLTTAVAVRGVHAGLWLDRYILHLESASSENKSKESRQTLVKDVAHLEIPAIYSLFYQRWLRMLAEAGVSLHNRREFTVRGRIAVGLGDESVLETSIALHRTYGVPYIPGCALKGLAATYARLMAGENWKQGSPAYDVVFGDAQNAGYLTFFDALYIPIKARQTSSAHSDHTEDSPDRPLRADIIAVHHPNYYQDKKDQKKRPLPPADWDSPTPIPFLSATGSYLIALAASPDLKNGDKWIEKTFEILTEALLVLGIGAKTSSGYGRMKNEQ